MTDWLDLIANADHWRIDVRPADGPQDVRFSIWTRDARGPLAGRWSRLTGDLSPERVRDDVIELLSQLLELEQAELAGTDPNSRRWAAALVQQGATA